MKVFTLALILLSAAAIAHAGANVDSEIARLRETRDQMASTAMVPIDRQYKIALERLLRTAMQNGDLDGANKVKEAIISIIPTDPSATIPLVAPASKSQVGLTKALLSNDWLMETVDGKYSEARKFAADGTWTSPKQQIPGTWKLIGTELTVTVGKRPHAPEHYTPFNATLWTGTGAIGDAVKMSVSKP